MRPAQEVGEDRSLVTPIEDPEGLRIPPKADKQRIIIEPFHLCSASTASSDSVTRPPPGRATSRRLELGAVSPEEPAGPPRKGFGIRDSNSTVATGAGAGPPPTLVVYELRCQNDALARMSRDELPTMRRYCPLGLTQPLRGSLHTDRSLRSSVSVTVER